MTKQNSFKVRDKRNRGWFWVENEYFNSFGKILGAGAIAVYVSLCRHADNEQKCFPSQKTIAEETKLSERTVRNIIKQLEEHKIIEITKERSEDGKWLNNVYWLLDKSEWIYPEANNADGKPEANKDIAGGKIWHSQRQYVPLNNTNRNNTNNNNTNILAVASATAEEINKIITFFKEVSPFSYKDYYKNLTERKSSAELLSRLPIEKLEILITKFLPKINVMPYVPKNCKAFKPSELLKNLDRIIVKIKELQQKRSEEKINIII